MSAGRRTLRVVLAALALAFGIGFGVGLWLRCAMERPVRLIGAHSTGETIAAVIREPAAR